MKQVKKDCDLSPVVLFTYKRLSVTQRVINALLMNPEARYSNLIVFSDGPKYAEDDQIHEVRQYLRSLSGFNSIELIFREQNLGLADSFINGITEVLNRFDSAIFIEDDNLVSPGFLSFMNNGLEVYKDDGRVSCISGYTYPIWPQQRRPFFIRGAETWSMATWRRSWQHFCSDARLLKAELEKRNLVTKFSIDGFRFYPMLESQIRGEIDSWGVRWWTSAFVKDMYCLYPHLPLCVSIGYGEDSVHCKGGYNPIFRRPSDLVSEIGFGNLPKKVSQTFRTAASIMLMNHLLLKLKSGLLRVIAK